MYKIIINCSNEGYEIQELEFEILKETSKTYILYMGETAQAISLPFEEIDRITTRANKVIGMQGVVWVKDKNKIAAAKQELLLALESELECQREILNNTLLEYEQKAASYKQCFKDMNKNFEIIKKEMCGEY